MIEPNCNLCGIPWTDHGYRCGERQSEMTLPSPIPQESPMTPITFPLYSATIVYSTLFTPMPPEWLGSDLASIQLADGSTVQVGWTAGPKGTGFAVEHRTIAATADDLASLLGRLAREAEGRAGGGCHPAPENATKEPTNEPTTAGESCP